jgi:hypothetical protein
VRLLFCFSRPSLRAGPLRLGLFGRHVALRGGLVLLGLAFCFIDPFPVTAPASSLARPFKSSTTPASDPDSFVKVASSRFPE